MSATAEGEELVSGRSGRYQELDGSFAKEWDLFTETPNDLRHWHRRVFFATFLVSSLVTLILVLVAFSLPTNDSSYSFTDSNNASLVHSTHREPVRLVFDACYRAQSEIKNPRSTATSSFTGEQRPRERSGRSLVGAAQRDEHESDSLFTWLASAYIRGVEMRYCMYQLRAEGFSGQGWLPGSENMTPAQEFHATQYTNKP